MCERDTDFWRGDQTLCELNPFSSAETSTSGEVAAEIRGPTEPDILPVLDIPSL